MDFSEKDFEETSKLAATIRRIENIDANYVNLVSDEIVAKQPFFLSVLIGYRMVTSPEELDEILKIYFLIWEYFKDNKGVQANKLTESYFEEVQQRNIEMLKCSIGEPTGKERLEIYAADLQNLQSKALLTAVLYRFNTKPVLLKMIDKKKGIILIGIKSLIECFEHL
jgi:hypothetical protein